MNDTDAVLASIDGALSDYEWSGDDAMRWVPPEARQETIGGWGMILNRPEAAERLGVSVEDLPSEDVLREEHGIVLARPLGPEWVSVGYTPVVDTERIDRLLQNAIQRSSADHWTAPARTPLANLTEAQRRVAAAFDVPIDLILFGSAYTDPDGNRIPPERVLVGIDPAQRGTHDAPIVFDIDHRLVTPVFDRDEVLTGVSIGPLPASRGVAAAREAFRDLAEPFHRAFRALQLSRPPIIPPEPMEETPQERALRLRQNRNTGPNRNPFEKRSTRT